MNQALEEYERLINLDFFKGFLSTELGQILGDQIDAFKNLSSPWIVHFSLGARLRNTWKLWDKENNSELIQFFHSIDIYHADDMSSICLDTYHRMLNGQEIDIEGQVSVIKEH